MKSSVSFLERNYISRKLSFFEKKPNKHAVDSGNPTNHSPLGFHPQVFTVLKEASCMCPESEDQASVFESSADSI